MGHIEIADLLISADVDDDYDYIRWALEEATWYAQKEVVERLSRTAKNHYDFHGILGYGRLLLCSAAMNGKRIQ